MEQLLGDLFNDANGQPIDLTDGSVKRPFEGKTEFREVDLVQALQHQGAPIVLASRFTNRGLQGIIAAYARLGPQYTKESTPLGQPDFRIDWKDGQRIPVNPPLSLAMIFSLSNRRDLANIRDHYYQFMIGSSSYFMYNECIPPHIPSQPLDGVINNGEGEVDLPVLPYSLNALADVRMVAVNIGNNQQYEVRREGKYSYAVLPLVGRPLHRH